MGSSHGSHPLDFSLDLLNKWMILYRKESVEAMITDLKVGLSLFPDS